MTEPRTPRDSAGDPRAERGAVASGGACLGPEEFSALWKRHGRVFWALAAGVLGRPDEIEDVLQEAAMIGFKRRAQFDPATSFTAWMGRVVRFVSLNRARLRQRRQTEAVDPVSIDQSFENVAGASEFDPRRELEYLEGQIDDELLRALGRLKARPRACLLLRALGELDYERIAEVLGIRAQTAMSHVHRARGELQRILSPVRGGAR